MFVSYISLQKKKFAGNLIPWKTAEQDSRTLFTSIHLGLPNQSGQIFFVKRITAARFESMPQNAVLYFHKLNLNLQWEVSASSSAQAATGESFGLNLMQVPGQLVIPSKDTLRTAQIFCPRLCGRSATK